MEEKTTRFEYVYQHLAADIERGALRPGDLLPSMHDLCVSYQVGINTVRDVLHALKVDGYIVLEERKRAVVAHRLAQHDETARACGLVARRTEVLDCFRTLELIMPPLFFLASRSCTDDELDGFVCAARRAGQRQRTEAWRLSRSSTVLHGLLEKAGNPLLSSCYTSLERLGRIPIIEGYESPYERATADSEDGVLAWIFSSLKRRDENEAVRRFGQMYRGTARYVEAYVDELAERYPARRGEDEAPAYTWNAKAGLEYVHGRIARDLVERISMGEIADGELLPSIAELSSRYGASPVTIQKACSMLNAIGIAKTVNGLGTRVRLGGESFHARWLEHLSFRRDVTTYVRASQMFCAVLPPALAATSPRIDDVSREVGRVLADEQGEWALSKALVEGFIACVEPPPLQTILLELNELLLWGRFFMLFATSKRRAEELKLHADRAFERLRAGDAEGFAASMIAYHRLTFRAVRAFLERAGMMGADRLLVP